MNNFSRIFPARNCKIYDRYFSMSKSLCKVIYRVFYTPDIIPFGIVSNQPVPNYGSAKATTSTAAAVSNSPMITSSLSRQQQQAADAAKSTVDSVNSSTK